MKKVFIQFCTLILCGSTLGSVHAMDIAITVDDIPANGDLPANMSQKLIADKMLAASKNILSKECMV